MANKMDPRVDSDRDGSHTVGGAGTTHTAGTGMHGAHGTHGTYGAGTTGMTGTHGTHATAGPHQSDMANKLDPRVDSDRDGSRTLGGTGAAYGSTHTGPTTGAYGSDTAYGHTGHGLTGGTTTSGPHRSDMANKMDPRVDSDRDGSRTVGGTTGTTGYGGTHGTGMTGTHGTHHTAGPHSSDTANKMDPRVDSDRDGSRTVGTGAGYGSTHTAGAGGIGGTHHTHGTHGTHGTHSSTGPGPAPHTAGPHKGDMLNKLDPRVDSDLDGSKTVGGDKTYSCGPHA